MPVTTSPRIEELRRRVQNDPTSIAFAQLAEEYRRMGDHDLAITTCRAGLAHHPSYLSARVTLGRALMELHRYNDARIELEAVLDLAADNLAAIRGLAEIHQRRRQTGDESPADEAPSADYASSVDEAPSADYASSVDEAPAVDEAPTAEREPSVMLTAVETLTLDLPPTPDFGSLNLDAAFPVPVEPRLTEPDQEESFEIPVSNPAIAELERWLAAIVEDRSHQQ